MIKQAKVWIGMGLTPDDIREMCVYARVHYQGIAQPASITSAYNMMRTDKQKNAADDLERQNEKQKALHGG